jgi:hypothetical protein
VRAQIRQHDVTTRDVIDPSREESCMSTQDPIIDADRTEQAAQRVVSPARHDLVRNSTLASRYRLGSAIFTTDPQGLPEQLVEAWSRWAASRLRQSPCTIVE